MPQSSSRLPLLRTRVPLPMLAAVEAAAEASQTSLSVPRALLSVMLTVQPEAVRRTRGDRPNV